jgi:hypothetical protein
MLWKLAGDAPPLWIPEPAPDGARVAMTTRLGGVSHPPFDTLNVGAAAGDDPVAVAENRRRVLARLGLAADRVATAGQVHGDRVVRVHAAGHHPGTDALVTLEPDLALAVTSADCLAIALVSSRAVAVAHSGWRGTAAGMPRTVLDTLCRESGSDPATVRVYLGPCIGPCCYRVGEEVAARFPAGAVRRDDAGPRVDLAVAARIQLADAGVPAASILPPPACTACSPAWCYSHRRDGARSGRLWGIVARGGAGL